MKDGVKNEGMTALVFSCRGIRMAAFASGIEGIVEMKKAEENEAKIVDLSAGFYIDAGGSEFKGMKALMVKGKDQKLGIAVEELEEITTYDRDSIKPLPPLVASVSGIGAFKGALLKGEDVLLLVDPSGGLCIGGAETGDKDNKDSQEVK